MWFSVCLIFLYHPAQGTRSQKTLDKFSPLVWVYVCVLVREWVGGGHMMSVRKPRAEL